MAIALGNHAVSNGGVSAVSSLTYALTVGSGTSILVVTVAMRNTTVSQASSVTFNGQALTKLTNEQYGTETRVEVWYMVNPPAVSANVVVTLDAAQYLASAAACYSGVNTANPFGTPVAYNNSGTYTASVTVTSPAGGVVIDALAKKGSGEVPSPDASQTAVDKSASTNATSTNNIYVGHSYKAATGSVAMSWTWATAQRQAAYIGVALNPFTGGRQFRAVIVG